jgi:signal transduction histidine kinase
MDHSLEREALLRKEFLRLTPEEEASLVKLKPLIAKHADDLVHAFYRHLLQFEETRRLLTNEMITNRLLAAQRKYLLELVGGDYGPQYVEDRLKIGRVHERIGLTPQWYLGAYNLYMALLLPLIHEEYRGRPAEFMALYMAFRKVVFLDIGLAIEAYIQKSNEKLEYANQELAAMAKELGLGLDRRTQELRQSQEHLEQAERLAELGTLASGMAHEIGTPMNVILGRAEYLQRKTKDPDTAKGLQTIIEQVERITKIMNQLLTFARRRPIERRPTNINKVVEDTLEVMQERLRRHRITVKTELAPSLPLADADPDQMGQVLLNLAINALHAMGDDGTLRVRTALVPVSGRSAEDYAEMIEVAVSDTGHGIPPEDLDKIFNPFFTTKEVGKGTGLGLTVVHGIVQEHGGRILVESEVRKGTIFRVHLPIAVARP